MLFAAALIRVRHPDTTIQITALVCDQPQTDGRVRPQIESESRYSDSYFGFIGVYDIYELNLQQQNHYNVNTNRETFCLLHFLSAERVYIH